MSVVPPFFSKFAKSASDLLSKKWEPKDFVCQTSVEHQSQGVTVSTTLSKANIKSADVNGKVKAAYKAKGFGEVSTEVGNDKKAKFTGKFDNLYDGVVVNTEGNFACGDACKKSGKLGVEYAAAPFTFTTEYACQDKATVSATVAMDRLSFGASVVASTAALNEKALNDVKLQLGVQYEDGAFTGSAVADRSNTAKVSLYNKVSPKLQLATQVNFDKLEATAIATGFQYVQSPSTTLKGKIAIKDSQTVVSGFVEHRFNTTTVVGVSKEFNLSTDSKKYGINLALGQY